MHNAHNYTSAYCTIYKTDLQKHSKFHKMFIKLNFFKTPRLEAQDSFHIPLVALKHSIMNYHTYMSFETCLRLANNDNLQGCTKYALVQRKKRQII
jgi:hypothetical protein